MSSQDLLKDAIHNYKIARGLIATNPRYTLSRRNPFHDYRKEYSPYCRACAYLGMQLKISSLTAAVTKL